ncbi:uncharacterized protein TM35_000471320, partial [Trypanosoma theileri]
MLLHRLLFLVALLLSVACVCGADEDVTAAQRLHSEAAVDSCTCDDPEKKEGACAPSTAKLPAAPLRPGESGHVATENLVPDSRPGPGTGEQRRDSDPHVSEQHGPELQKEKEPLSGHNNVQGEATDTLRNNPKAQPSLSSSLGQQASSGSSGPVTESQTRTNGGTSQDSQEENRNTGIDTGS